MIGIYDNGFTGGGEGFAGPFAQIAISTVGANVGIISGLSSKIGQCLAAFRDLISGCGAFVWNVFLCHGHIHIPVALPFSA